VFASFLEATSAVLVASNAYWVATVLAAAALAVSKSFLFDAGVALS
jgi:hypothetical protein